VNFLYVFGRSYMKILSFVLVAVFMCVSTAHTQKWARLAEFPEPTEELLGASAGGKLYVFCGLAPGWKPMGLVYEYDPATDTWTKKKPMPLASHHVAFTEYRGKIYVIGGRVGAAGMTAASNTNVVEQYDPGTDSWGGCAHGCPPRVVPWRRACMAAASMSRAASIRTAR
jgi:N-acetylneuraminic acid mutarotase